MILFSYRYTKGSPKAARCAQFSLQRSFSPHKYGQNKSHGVQKRGFLGKHEKWHLDGKNIEVVNEYTYLGYTFTTKMSVTSQVKWFISETPVGVHERTSMKEHLVRHGSKHKIQVLTTKRNKRQQKRKQNRTHFQNKKQRETRERSLTKTKARVKNENRWVQHTHTHSLTYTTRACTSTRPPPLPPPLPPHTHTQDLGKRRGIRQAHLLYKK